MLKPNAYFFGVQQLCVAQNVFFNINLLVLLFTLIAFKIENYEALRKFVSSDRLFVDQLSTGVCPTGVLTKTYTRTTSPNSVVFSTKLSSN